MTSVLVVFGVLNLFIAFAQGSLFNFLSGVSSLTVALLILGEIL